MLTQTEPRLVPSRGRYRLPAVMMRAGTSRGLFIHRSHMPSSVSDWAAVLLSAMGSRDGDLRQIDGLGGGSSTTSKVIVVSKSELPGIDVEYTFVQVAVGKAAIDMTGNCGNMSSGVAAFALDEGLVQAKAGDSELSVRVYNTNTGSTIVETIQVDADGRFRDEGSYSIPGIRSRGSPIKLTFENPSGSMTGTLFPTGRLQETLSVPALTLPTGDVLPAFDVQVTLIDGANPFVFVDGTTMPALYQQVARDSIVAVGIVEAIRRQAAVCAGLAVTPEAAALTQGTPKIALLWRPDPITVPATASELGDNDGIVAKTPGIRVVAYSMGKVHPSLQLTGAVTLGAALGVPGTVPAGLAGRGSKTGLCSPPETPLKEPADEVLGSTQEVADGIGPDLKTDWVIAHPGGLMDVQVTMTRDIRVKSATVFRTARRVFEGNVLVTI